MVRVVDLMVASALRTILHNTITSLLDAMTLRTATKHESHEEDEEEICSMFLVKVTVESGTVVCSPTQETLMGGLRAVIKSCEATVLSTQPLLPYFTPHDRLSSVTSEENLVLRLMLEDDSHLRNNIESVLALLEDSWRKVEAEVDPLRTLLQQTDTKTHEEGIQGQELSELGSWLAQVEGLVEAARGLKEVVALGLLQVDQTAARKLLVTSLRQQQQRIHQDVSQGFDQRVRALLADANDKWLGLELAPVTAQQVVTLLNYVTEVKNQMELVNREEEVIRKAYEMIQGYHITLHAEVHNKYEALQKEVKRLRKSVRRSLMERPTAIRKLKQLLDKEIEEVAAETAKLAEQVQALRFLRVTSDREEALKMLEAADSRASTIRTQATTVIDYQTTFQMPVCPFKDLVEVEQEISLKMLLWRSLYEWEELTERWYQNEVRSLDVKEVSGVTLKYREKLDYLMAATAHSDVLLHLQSLITHLQEKLPVLEALTDSALRPRHWQEIDAALSEPLPSSLTLAHVDEMGLHKHAHTLQQVAHTAQLQRDMEDRLKKVEESWEAATIPVVDYIRKDMFVLGDLAQLDSLLLDTDLTLHLLLHSQHALHIKSETIRWKNIHTIIRQTLVALRDFEEEWVALEPVLSSCSAHEIFPLHASVFASVSTFWRLTMTRVKEEPRVLQQVRGGMLEEETLQEKTQMEGLRASLAPLLAKRRQTCPRLFLLPDAHLLQLLTKGQEPKVCHRYLRRLFTGVGRLVHGKDGKIVALVSPQEELLSLAKVCSRPSFILISVVIISGYHNGFNILS
ncbi:dynein axonemal heavy chain 6-like [Cherax quadricarinatus]|uniref:dynein axonemal heavy chain 6-like n=1 Tax=Cherax quadricarinatus TaxID=27406 RepID=UPI002377E655|nr:dynein axonemal heavy chain 6-like [Cherax quadricarinatus]